MFKVGGIVLWQQEVEVFFLVLFMFSNRLVSQCSGLMLCSLHVANRLYNIAASCARSWLPANR
ncbi:MAG: hypothetical protein IPH58_19165 [Sphingobacteriales bacterium]|nr:hypothetical protein [Sphingobacteriales bacterium]